jgi:hypothetical protein
MAVLEDRQKILCHVENPTENILNDCEPQMTVLSPVTTHQCGSRSGNSRCATRRMAKERVERRKHDQNQRQLKYEAGDDRDREWFPPKTAFTADS